VEHSTPWLLRFARELMGAGNSAGVSILAHASRLIGGLKKFTESSKHIATLALALGILPMAMSCAGTETTTLVCEDREVNRVMHVLKVTASSRTAELVVHVPQESIDRGTPAGNRRGSALVSDRAYEITIPGDSGGQGEQVWSRLKFQFEIDRYSGTGTLWIGEEEHGERAARPIRCRAEDGTPRL
jgi:hypothetical protein